MGPQCSRPLTKKGFQFFRLSIQESTALGVRGGQWLNLNKSLLTQSCGWGSNPWLCHLAQGSVCPRLS